MSTGARSLQLRRGVQLLLANALFWLDRYGSLDGLRVDAVAFECFISTTAAGQEAGFRTSTVDARNLRRQWNFLRRVNTEVLAKLPMRPLLRKNRPHRPQVSRPIEWGGLGFSYEWNIGWMRDTLDYISKDPIHRRPPADPVRLALMRFRRISFFLCRTIRSCTENARISGCRVINGSALQICAPSSPSCTATRKKAPVPWERDR